jgi:hypothetical protein
MFEIVLVRIGNFAYCTEISKYSSVRVDTRRNDSIQTFSDLYPGLCYLEVEGELFKRTRLYVSFMMIEVLSAMYAMGMDGFVGRRTIQLLSVIVSDFELKSSDRRTNIGVS